jgi:HprK-related kinase A
MMLSLLGLDEVHRRLCGAGIAVRVGPFIFRIRSPVFSVASGVSLLYADYQLAGENEFVDFDVRLDSGAGLRCWIRPQVRFLYDGMAPFEPLPVGHAMPFLEWAMNWCISSQAHQYLILHAAVIERDGFAAILPAPSGSGKSTLCAGLMSRGWRLLSDELTLISPGDTSITPLCRPVSLKNQSLSVIQAFEPSAEFSAVTHDTAKGTVCHMKVPKPHLDRVGELAMPGWVVFPKYVQGASACLTPRSRASSMLDLGRNAFNYTLLGRAGFEALADVIDASDCHDFEYGSLDDAVAVFDDLAGARRR